MNPGASELLKVLAFLYPERIPIEILTESAVRFGPLLTPVVTDSLAFENVIGVLLRSSLIQRNREEQTITLHRIIQRVVKEKMSEGVQQRWVVRAVEAVSAVGSDPEWQRWQRYPLYVSQAMACVALVEEWDLLSTSAAALLSKMGAYLHSVYRFEEAANFLKQAVKIVYEQPGTHALQVATLLSELGSIYKDWGKYAEAEPLCAQALAIWEQELGPRHPDTVTSLNNLGLLYREQGKYAEAEPLMKQALTIREQSLGAEHPTTKIGRSNYTGLLRDLG